jgi:hypothetical protein
MALDEREKGLLGEIAGHEFFADPKYVERFTNAQQALVRYRAFSLRKRWRILYWFRPWPVKLLIWLVVILTVACAFWAALRLVSPDQPDVSLRPQPSSTATQPAAPRTGPGVPGLKGSDTVG